MPLCSSARRVNALPFLALSRYCPVRRVRSSARLSRSLVRGNVVLHSGVYALISSQPVSRTQCSRDAAELAAKGRTDQRSPYAARPLESSFLPEVCAYLPASDWAHRTISVMSSFCLAPAANASAARMMQAMISLGCRPWQPFTVFINRSSPHSSSAAFMASLIPSVKAMRMSPGTNRQTRLLISGIF